MKFNIVSFRIRNVLAGSAAALGLTLVLTAQVNAAVFVDADLHSPTFIGTLTAGQSYRVTAAGIANLDTFFNGGLGLTFAANGIPTYDFPAPYSPFYPDGLDYDPSVGPSAYGQGGPGKLLGSLLGTYTATPTGPSDFFSIGLGTTIRPSTSETLYVVVNDTYYRDNGGGYSVLLTTGVPESETWVMMLIGFAGLGIVGYRSSRRDIAAGFSSESQTDSTPSRGRPPTWPATRRARTSREFGRNEGSYAKV